MSEACVSTEKKPEDEVFSSLRFFGKKITRQVNGAEFSIDVLKNEIRVRITTREEARVEFIKKNDEDNTVIMKFYTFDTSRNLFVLLGTRGAFYARDVLSRECTAVSNSMKDAVSFLKEDLNDSDMKNERYFSVFKFVKATMYTGTTSNSLPMGRCANQIQHLFLSGIMGITKEGETVDFKNINDYKISSVWLRYSCVLLDVFGKSRNIDILYSPTKHVWVPLTRKGDRVTSVKPKIGRENKSRLHLNLQDEMMFRELGKNFLKE
jgi:hypothetical protein